MAISIDAHAYGPRFDGLGGVSAGTGPRLLVDYEEPTRAHILDYLFLPNFGAGIQTLKIEIGGGGDSTQGTEASHEPRRGVLVPDAGYEFWIAKEAKARNPRILLYGLAWNFPGWVNNDSDGSAGPGVQNQRQLWSANFSVAAGSYLADWLAVARDSHGLHVDTIGWQNEHTWRSEWVVDFRRTLDARGFSGVRIAVGDCGPGPGYQTPDITERIKGDPALNAAASIVGLHYPVSIMPVQANASFYEGLWSLNQTLWSSEEFSTYADSSGGRCLAKLFSRNYIDARLTASLVWDMLWSSFDGLACSGQGILWAAEPWSGAYAVADPVWSMAHHTQFTEPGWLYLEKGRGAGYLPKPGGADGFWGSFVGLVSNTSSAADFTLVVETMNAADSSCGYGNGGWVNVTTDGLASTAARFCISPSVCAAHGPRLTFFRTATNGSSAERFARQPDVALDGGCCFVLDLSLNAIHTFSTTDRARKGTHAGDRAAPVPEGAAANCGYFSTPLHSAPFPLPFATNFSDGRYQDFPRCARPAHRTRDASALHSHLRVGRTPRLRSIDLSDIAGVFRVADGALHQTLLSPSSTGVQYGQPPTTLLGEKNWADYSVATRARLPADALAGEGGGDAFVAVYARLGNAYSFQSAGGYWLCCSARGWQLGVTLANASGATLARGAPGCGDGAWHELELEAAGDSLTARLDGAHLATQRDGAWPRGMAGIGSGYHRASFASFRVF
jgi:hypothetical protein